MSAVEPMGKKPPCSMLVGLTRYLYGSTRAAADGRRSEQDAPLSDRGAGCTCAHGSEGMRDFRIPGLGEPFSQRPVEAHVQPYLGHGHIAAAHLLAGLPSHESTDYSAPGGAPSAREGMRARTAAAKPHTPCAFTWATPGWPASPLPPVTNV